MKKFFIGLILVLSAVQSAFGVEPIQLASTNPYVAGVGVSAASTNTVNVSRGFESDSDPTGWTETDTGTLLNRYDTAQYHDGTHSMSVAMNGSTTVAYYAYDTGGTRSSASICMWVYAPTTGGNDNIDILQFASTLGNPGIRVYYQQSATGGYYHFGIRGTSLVWGTTNITTGAWYRLEISYVQNSTSTITVFNAAGTQVDTVSCTANNVNSRYVYIGRVEASGRTDWSTIYFDSFGMDWTDATTPLWPYTVEN